MKTERYMQVVCISESNASDFQIKMNEALSHLPNPEITLDKCIPFTAYIIYKVKRDVPESVLELLELIDGDPHTCVECPYYEEPSDKRMKWGICKIKLERMRLDNRACERFYLWRSKELEQAEQLYNQIPFLCE